MLIRALILVSWAIITACGQAKFEKNAGTFATLNSVADDSTSADSRSSDSLSSDDDCRCCLSDGQGHGTEVIVSDGTQVPAGAKLRSGGRLCLHDDQVNSFLESNPAAQGCGTAVPTPDSGT